jgi:outer membrane receptor protein involved in Fe transport
LLAPLRACARVLALACLVLPASGAAADPATTPPAAAETEAEAAEAAPDDPEPEERATLLGEIVVEGREDSLVGIADSASEGTVGAVQLERRPLNRPGEILETVPGLILTQHSGAGKANQFFLRGFNLDHGTDFATSIDGVPVNLPSHGHGQGYTDLNFLIPELVQRVDYQKGVYSAANGDFSSAGAANLVYFDELPKRIVQLEGGLFDYYRGLLAGSAPLAEGNLLYALELFHDDGPWEHPDGFKKLNAVLRFSRGDAALGWSVTASAYASEWDATDQVTERAIDAPGFDRFDSLDETTGGTSQKYMLYGEWHRSDERSASRILAYGFYQYLDLFSNFTYFLSSPQGDQFEQLDDRWVGGAKGFHTFYGHLGAMPMENTVGLQLRSDSIRNGLFQTIHRDRVTKLDYDGGELPSTTRRDRVWELSVAPYLENRIQWHEKLRTVLGVRADYYRFDVDGNQSFNSGTEDDAIVSPKGSIVIGPWAQTELYLSGGLGFHSNDARGVTDPVDPTDPLVRTQGAEVGIRSAYVPGLNTTLALWWLDIDSELLFVGDAGSTEASRPSRRYGIELASYYSVTRWLTLDLDVSLSRARFRDSDPAGNEIPGSVESVIAAGATVHDLGGFFGSIRLRYFGPRALVEDDSVRSDPTLLLSARVGYEFDETWSVSAEVFNLLNRDDDEIAYYYASRLPDEAAGPDEGGYDDLHVHPVYPASFRLALTARF